MGKPKSCTSVAQDIGQNSKWPSSKLSRHWAKRARHLWGLAVRKQAGGACCFHCQSVGIRASSSSPKHSITAAPPKSFCQAKQYFGVLSSGIESALGSKTYQEEKPPESV